MNNDDDGDDELYTGWLMLKQVLAKSFDKRMHEERPWAKERFHLSAELASTHFVLVAMTTEISLCSI